MKRFQPNEALEIYNLRTWDNQLVSVHMLGRRVTSIGQSLGLRKRLDGKGKRLLPGPIDGHVHDRSPGQHHKETIKTIGQAALQGGVTSIISQANTSPPITTYERLTAKVKKIRTSRVRRRQWFGATPRNKDQFRLAASVPECAGIKVCMANTTGTGEMLVDKPNDQYEILCEAATHNLLVDVHAEIEAMIQRNIRRLRDQGIRCGMVHHCEIRDAPVETAAVHAITELGLRTGARLNICHVSAPQSVHIILDARRRGLDVSFEWCPQYGFLNTSDLAGPRGAYVKCNPSVRPPEDMQEMLRILCDDTVNDKVVATDHAPHTHDDKRADTYEGVPSGMPGLDTYVSLLLNLVHQKLLSWEQFVEVTSRYPAERFGLAPLFANTPSHKHDWIIVDPNEQVTFSNGSHLGTKCGWTPYDGWTAHGAIKATFVAGQLLYWNW